MPRPPKDRRIENIPEIKYFKPAGVPARNINEINLTLEEVEAIRLKDMEGLIQEDCAQHMRVSRPTFQRILTEARKKIAEALLTGQALRFQGGNYQLAQLKYNCLDCGNVFKLTPSNGGRRGRNRNRTRNCPRCGSSAIERR